jgi:hypothetical protein
MDSFAVLVISRFQNVKLLVKIDADQEVRLPSAQHQGDILECTHKISSVPSEFEKARRWTTDIDVAVVPLRAGSLQHFCPREPLVRVAHKLHAFVSRVCSFLSKGDVSEGRAFAGDPLL